MSQIYANNEIGLFEAVGKTALLGVYASYKQKRDRG